MSGCYCDLGALFSDSSAYSSVLGVNQYFSKTPLIIPLCWSELVSIAYDGRTPTFSLSENVLQAINAGGYEVGIWNCFSVQNWVEGS